jgi:hypothetical protein
MSGHFLHLGEHLIFSNNLVSLVALKTSDSSQQFLPPDLLDVQLFPQHSALSLLYLELVFNLFEFRIFLLKFFLKSPTFLLLCYALFLFLAFLFSFDFILSMLKISKLPLKVLSLTLLRLVVMSKLTTLSFNLLQILNNTTTHLNYIV